MSKKETKSTKVETTASDLTVDLSADTATDTNSWSADLKKTFAIVGDIGDYRVVAVDFNPTNAEVIRTCYDRAEAIEAFKIAVANSGMLG